MAMVRTTEKVVLENYKRGTSEESGLDYEIVEKVIGENYVSQISIQELIDKLNEIANSKDAMVIVEVLGLVRTPAIILENFEAYIETRKTDEGIEETFKLVSHTDDVGNLEFNALKIHSVEWNKWSSYSLIKFEGNIEIMISDNL